MTEAELLNKVKTGLSISGNFHDEILQIYIDEVKEFMLSSGVAKAVVESPAAVGCIMLGVNDLWNYTSGGAKFSEYFKQRLVQLSLKAGAENVQTE